MDPARPQRLAARLSAMFIARVLAAMLLTGAGAAAQDRFSVDGDVDLRWVHASGAASFMNGGDGLLRFDPDHDGLEFGRAFLAPKWRLTDSVSVRAVVDAYGDHDRNPVDLSECYLDVRPFPEGPVRWHARVGAFFLPVSLENRGIGWSAVYAITPSAINTWIGEEFRTLGAELEARWLGASVGYLGDVAAIAGVYGWNDSAGVLLARRGFALTDRPSTLFGDLGSPPVDFYHEIDHRPGAYGGIAWRHHDRLEVRLLRYDNRGDPAAETAAGRYAWRTRFTSAGARLEPTAHLTFIAQFLDGDTAAGVDDYDSEQSYLRFRARFALASYDIERLRFTVRYDDFHTREVADASAADDQDGHAWTFAGTADLSDHWQFVAEWLRVASRFPQRLALGEAADQVQSQLQLALRYRFQLSGY